MARGRPAAPVYVSFGQPVDASGGDHFPMTYRDINVRVEDGRMVDIGVIYDRSGYDHAGAGYPQAFEVWRYGSGTWNFYPTAGVAEAGAREFAAAFLRAGGRTTNVPSPWDKAQAGRCRECGQALPDTG